MAQRNLRAAADAAERQPDRAAELGVDAEEIAALARRGRGDGGPLRRRPRRPPAGRGLHPPRALGLRRHRRPRATRCCCTTPTSTCTASRSSSRPTWCSRCTCAATRSPTSRRRATSPTTSALTVRDSSLSACTQAVHRRRGRPPRARLRLLRRGGADRPRRHRAQHPRRPAPRRRSPARGSSRSRASAACATTTASCRSSRGSRAQLTRLGFGLLLPRPPAARRGRPRSARRYTLRAGEPLEVSHHGEQLTIAADAAQERRIPPLSAPGKAPTQPAGRAPVRRRRPR